MAKVLTVPHRCKEGLCPVNGIRDLVQWRAAGATGPTSLYGVWGRVEVWSVSPVNRG